MASWNVKLNYSVKGSIRQRATRSRRRPPHEASEVTAPGAAAPAPRGGLLATTSHYYAGASATRDRRDRDDPREALADFGRRDEDEPRDVTDALDR